MQKTISAERLARALTLRDLTNPLHGPHAMQLQHAGRWVEIGECGLIGRGMLDAAGLQPEHVGGLAIGLGLDRLLMLRKGIEDIRLLRSVDPRIANQMLNLSPYRAVSQLPPVKRDLSIAVDEGTDAETLGDRVREALTPGDDVIESVTVRSETPSAELPPSARKRMGLLPSQKNVLLTVVLRHPSKSLTAAEANVVRNRIYAALHEGEAEEIASSKRS